VLFVVMGTPAPKCNMRRRLRLSAGAKAERLKSVCSRIANGSVTTSHLCKAELLIVIA
jgi:hypothetical protein